MFKYIMGRIGAMLLTIFLVMTLSFWVIRLMPMTIFENPEVPPEVQYKLEDRMHLHDPMIVQYFYFLEGIVTRGDFGTSVKMRDSAPRVSSGICLTTAIAFIMAGPVFCCQPDSLLMYSWNFSPVSR